MKKFFTIALLVLFVISLTFSVVSAQGQDESSETVEGWASYISTGRALVTANPIVYFNRNSRLLIWVEVTNQYTNDQELRINNVDVYHYATEIYGGTGNLMDTHAPFSIVSTDPDPITPELPFSLGVLSQDETDGSYVSVRLSEDLQRRHSLFADAVRPPVP